MNTAGLESDSSTLVPQPQPCQRARSSCGDVSIDEKVLQQERSEKYSVRTAASEGASLSIHSVVRSTVGALDDGRTQHVVILPPPATGSHGVQFQQWRDQYGQVELKVEPLHQKLVESGVRLLSKVYAEELSHRNDSGACEITNVIAGPEGARFPPGTASISYCLGHCESLIPRDVTERGREEIEEWVRNTYFPVQKGHGNGQRWEAAGDFTVNWRGDELWLKTELPHFSEHALAGKKCRLFRRKDKKAVCPILSSPRLQPNALQSGPQSKCPLGSDPMPAGHVYLRNFTKEELHVLLAPLMCMTTEEASYRRAAQAGLTIPFGGIAGGGSAQQSNAVAREPGPGFYDPCYLIIPTSDSRLVELPGHFQSRLLWCSVTKSIKPDDLPLSETSCSLDLENLKLLGYKVQRRKPLSSKGPWFVRTTSSGESIKCETLRIVTVWDNAPISPLHYSSIYPDKLSGGYVWRAALSGTEQIEGKFRGYFHNRNREQ